MAVRMSGIRCTLGSIVSKVQSEMLQMQIDDSESDESPCGSYLVGVGSILMPLSSHGAPYSAHEILFQLLSLLSLLHTICTKLYQLGFPCST
jgi:hypothetical protein